MKQLLTLLILLSLTANAQRTTKEQRIQKKINEVIAYYKYPVDERTNRITYDKVVETPGISKSVLFKRALQFLALQDFGRAENIRCKNNTNITTPIVTGELLINDPEDGKIAGYGFTHLDYSIRGEYHYILTFKYLLHIKDNSYRYQFTDFRVLEFLSAPKEKSRSSAYVGNLGYGSGIAAGSALRTFSDASLVQEDLEDFILHGVWQNQDAGHNEFKAKLKRLIGDLKQSMLGEL